MTHKKRGPKPKCPWNVQLAELQKYPVFDESGKLKEEQKYIPMWTEISKNIRKAGYKIKVHNLHQNVAQNRDDLLTKLKKLSENKEIASTNQNLLEKLVQTSNIPDLETLWKLIRDALIKPIISEFSPFPFSLSFCSNDGIKLAKLLKPKILCVFGSVQTFTENVVISDEYTSQTVESYCLGAFVGNDFTPLAHIFTESESKPLLVKFFLNLLRSGLPPPAKIVVDYRQNHVHAVVESFNTNYYYEKFLTHGFCSLKEENVLLPSCQVCIDFRSIIIVVESWDFRPADLSDILKDFYVDIFNLLHFQKSLDGFTQILKNVFILTVNEFENDDTSNSFNDLKVQIEKVSSENNFYKNDASPALGRSIKKIDVNLKKCEIITSYLTEILDEAASTIKKNVNEGTRKNSFFSETITKNILELCVEFIAWSRVLNEKYELKEMQSSACLENYKDQFLLLSEKTVPLRVNDHLLKTISYTENKISNHLKIGCENLDSSQHAIDQSVEPEDRSFLKCAEQWMGLNMSDESDKTSDEKNVTDSEISATEIDTAGAKDDSKHELITGTDKIKKRRSRKACRPKKRGPLLEPCPDFFAYRLVPKKISRKRRVIKNYNRLPIVEVNDSPVSVLSSSIFDSFTEVFTSSFYLIEKFQFLVQTQSKNNDFFSLIENYATNLNLDIVFNSKRAEMLVSFMTDKFMNKLYWTYGAALFINKMLIPSILFKCSICNQDSKNSSCTLQIALGDLQNALKDINSSLSQSTANCISCGNLINSEITIKDFVIIDVEIFDGNDDLDINTVPLHIAICSNKFALTGVISFKEGLSEPYIRHYVAYCLKSSDPKTGKRSWTVFDDSEKRPQIVTAKNINVKPAVLIFIQYENPHDTETCQPMEIITDQTDQSSVKGVVQEVAHPDFTDICPKLDRNDTPVELVDDESIICEQNNSIFDLTSDGSSAIETSTPKKVSPVAKNILEVDRHNVGLSHKEKDKTKFYYKDIDLAILSWEERPRKTNMIDNAGNQGKIKFELDKNELILKFKNTCGFDSIIESLKHSSQENEIFRKDVENTKSQNEFLNALINYCNSGDLEKLYLFRAKAMFIRVPTSNDPFLGLTKDCQTNLCSLFKDIMEGLPSTTIIGTCSKCGDIQERKNYVTAIDYVKFFEDGISRIANMLEHDLVHRELCCTKCQHMIDRKNLVLGNYMAYDLELMHETFNEKRLSKKVGKTIKDYKTDIRDVPKSIKICNKYYSLSAVVEFIELTETFMHYVAYCRSTIGHSDRWIRYDDLTGSQKQVQLESLSPIKISLLLYTVAKNRACM